MAHSANWPKTIRLVFKSASWPKCDAIPDNRCCQPWSEKHFGNPRASRLRGVTNEALARNDDYPVLSRRVYKIGKVFCSAHAESVRCLMNVLIDENTLRAGVDRLAMEIENRYRGKPLTLVGVLLGSVIFLADLMRRLTIPYGLEMISSRQMTDESNSQGPLIIQADLLAPEVAGRHVLIIDDIYDTGETLWQLIPQFDEFKVASVHAAVLLKKKGRQRVPLGPTLVGFEIPDVFVVGYGMDHHGRFRNLPYIAALSPEEMRDPGRTGG